MDNFDSDPKSQFDNKRPPAKAGRHESGQSDMKQSAVSSFLNYVGPVFKRPEFLQAAALCTRDGAKGPEVLMITSLTTKRWIVPKGWPMEGRSLAEAAQQEAWEEAGVEGHIDDEPLGSYTYRKTVRGGIPVTCRCYVYRLRVDALTKTFPEKGRRERIWMSPAAAASAVDEPELKALLRGLGKNDG